MVHRSSVNDVKNLYAEFVVDTSGRNSETPEWLEEMDCVQMKKVAISTDHNHTLNIYNTDNGG